jgi:ABC-2 type transport system permease protein
MNIYGIMAIYKFEMARTKRTLVQSIVAPVITTSLYFIVFGAAIGSRIDQVSGISYGAFIVPGLIMLNLLTHSISNASFGIYFPKFVGTVYEMLSAPVSTLEVVLGYVGAAASKAVILGIIILIAHPILMMVFILLTAISFSLFGFILGIWADNFEKLSIVPMLLVTPLVFLGGSFYSTDMLPEPWQTISHFNPVLYLVSGLRWSFYEISEVNVMLSLASILIFMFACLGVVYYLFKTGYKLRS